MVEEEVQESEPTWTMMMSRPLGGLTSIERLSEAQLTLPGGQGKEGLGRGFRATVQEQMGHFKTVEPNHAPLIDAECWVVWQSAHKKEHRI